MIGITVGGLIFVVLALSLLEWRLRISHSRSAPESPLGGPRGDRGDSRGVAENPRSPPKSPQSPPSPQSFPGGSQPPQRRWVVANEIDHPEGHELDAPPGVHELPGGRDAYELDNLDPNSAASSTAVGSPSSGKRVSFDPSLGLPIYPRGHPYTSATRSGTTTQSSAPQSHLGAPPSTLPASPAVPGSASTSVEPSPILPPSPISSTAEQGQHGTERASGVSAVASSNGSATRTGNYTAYNPSVRSTMQTMTTATGASPGYQSPEEAIQEGFHDKRE